MRIINKIIKQKKKEKKNDCRNYWYGNWVFYDRRW